MIRVEGLDIQVYPGLVGDQSTEQQLNQPAKKAHPGMVHVQRFYGRGVEGCCRRNIRRFSSSIRAETKRKDSLSKSIPHDEN